MTKCPLKRVVFFLCAEPSVILASYVSVSANMHIKYKFDKNSENCFNSFIEFEFGCGAESLPILRCNDAIASGSRLNVEREKKERSLIEHCFGDRKKKTVQSSRSRRFT